MNRKVDVLPETFIRRRVKELLPQIVERGEHVQIAARLALKGDRPTEWADLARWCSELEGEIRLLNQKARSMEEITRL